MKYVVKANRRAIVDGLAAFEEGDEKTFTQSDVDSYTEVTGLRLNQGNLPEGLELTVKSKDGE